MQAEIEQGHWLRSTTRSIGIGGAWLIYAAAFTWLAFQHHERAGNAEVVSPVVTAMVLFLALPGYVLGVRQLRCGLWIDRNSLIVRGMFRTLRLSPNEVDGFKPERRGSFIGPMLHRKHGRPVRLGAVGSRPKAKSIGCESWDRSAIN
jgi:hypothetical protein